MKQWKIRKFIEDINFVRERISDKLVEAKNSEEINNKGVAKDANLNITICALNYISDTPLNPTNSTNEDVYIPVIDGYVKITYCGKEVKTQAKANTSNPVWFEEFNLQVKSKENIILFELFDNKEFIKNKYIGKYILPSTILEDQNKIEMQLKLIDENDIVTNYVLFVKLHLVWSKIKMHEDLIKKFDDKELKYKDELALLESYEELCKIPFGLLIHSNIESIIENKNILEGEPDIGAMGRRSVYGKVSNISNNLRDSRVNAFFGSSNTNFMTKKSVEFPLIMYYLTLIIFILVTLSSTIRKDYFSVKFSYS